MLEGGQDLLLLSLQIITDALKLAADQPVVYCSFSKKTRRL